MYLVIDSYYYILSSVCGEAIDVLPSNHFSHFGVSLLTTINENFIETFQRMNQYPLSCMLWLFSLVLVFCISNALTCESNKVYVKTIKKSGQYANEEGFYIFDGVDAVAESVLFADDETRTVEYCLKQTTNNQYTVFLYDEYWDGWSAGGWLSIEGPYGNQVFKGSLYDYSDEEYNLSLYMPIKKNESWKMTTTAPESGWINLSFSDASWNEVTLGSVTTVTPGTQYFRKTFAGIPNQAAYELRLQYQYGIIAYINGVEVVRDNMPEGVVTSTTPATGSYSSLLYRGIIRSASEASLTNSILAVELHFTNATHATCDFNAWLAMYASSLLDKDCYVVEHGVVLSADAAAFPNRAYDYDITTYVSVNMIPFTLDFTFPSDITPTINGLSIYPGTSNYNSPSNFVFEGSFSSEPSSTFTPVVTGVDVVYTLDVWKTISSMFTSNLYKAYRFRVTGGTSVYLTEIHPLVCNVPSPTTIEFPQTEYTYIVNYQEVDIAPVVTEFSNCTLSPALPEGVTFNSATCSISGIPTSAVSGVTYTMVSVMGGISGTFTLTTTVCTGTMVEIIRTYKYNPQSETFTIVNADTEAVIFAVAAYTSQVANRQWSYNLCIPCERISVDLGDTSREWSGTSYIMMNAYLTPSVKEPLMRNRYDTYINNPTSTILRTMYTIPAAQQWSYKMGVVPENWYNTDMTGWTDTASVGSFPQSTNQIQLYKKQFTVSSLQNLGAISITLRYRYGYIIYLNGHEAARLGFEGPLTVDTTSSAYTGLEYRTITLPLKVSGSGSPINYIQQNNNVIAIALIGTNASQKDATFDCALRFLGAVENSRLFEFESFASMSTDREYAFDMLSNTKITGSQCTTNYYGIRFKNERREWISSVTVQNNYVSDNANVHQFLVQARNSNSETWTTIGNVTNLPWSMAGQKNRVYLSNDKAWNQYQFANFGTGDSGNCRWTVNQVDFIADDRFQVIPALSYPDSNTIFKDIEMAEIYPSNGYYTDFSITPSLPTGVTINAFSGVISGTASVFVSTTQYTITAKDFLGTPTSVPFSLSVQICTNGKALITVTIRADAYPHENSYKMYQGRGTTGEVVSSVGVFPVKSSLFYIDNCLNDGLYTFQGIDSFGDGWSIPSGYMLTVDVGKFRFATNMVPSGTKPVSATTTFSSYVPFQMEYTDYKVFKNTEQVPSQWNAREFDDASWTTMKATEIGTSEAVTVYIRKTFDLPNLDDYNTLNVRIRYAGGVVAYFNGQKVARFNLIGDFDSTTESIQIHDPETDSKFHVILSLAGVVGNNVMAFEVHRPKDQSSAIPVIFDATAVFSVESCGLLADTYTVLNHTATTEGQITSMFDLNPENSCTLPNLVGSFVEWSVENLEGSFFNRYGYFASKDITRIGHSLYGRMDSSDEWTVIHEQANVAVKSRKLGELESPVGMASFREFKWEEDAVSNVVFAFHGFVFSYCKPAGSGFCPGVDDYPAVGEGEISPGRCVTGFTGYSFRQCTNGQLGEINTEHCKHKLPANLAYENSYFTFVIDTNVSVPPPKYDNIIEKFYLDQNEVLPEGLVLDETTGAITGIPKETLLRKEFDVFGSNPSGVVRTTISIGVKLGECKAEGNYPKTFVGETATYECSSQGSYVGTQTRKCVLGEKDGEWQKIEGMCVSIFSITLVCVIVIVIVIVVVFILVRSRKTKAVGGVKNKKAVPKKTAMKKTVNKEVKVQLF